jgi:hypothetical protein
MDRRGFIKGLGGLFVAAPAIVRAASLMPVRGAPLITKAVVPLFRGPGGWIVHPDIVRADPTMLARLEQLADFYVSDGVAVPIRPGVTVVP